MQETFGKYRLTSRLAMGGMAEVFLATVHGEAGFSKPVVIKRLHPRLSEDSEFVQMLIDEARITAQLSHSNICQVLDLGQFDGSYYIAMEYIAGEDLRTLQDHYGRLGSYMPVEAAIYVISEVLAGLEIAHRKEGPDGQPLGVIHRDVSPQNVLVSYEGEVKVIDFGIAKARSRLVQTQAGVIKGKFRYMSPEQASGQPIDARTDVFAAGVVLYELLRGSPHSVDVADTEVLRRMREAEFEPIRRSASDVPDELLRVVSRALHRRAKRRYPTAAAFRKALHEVMHQMGISFGRSDLALLMKDVFPSERRRERSGSFSQERGPEVSVPSVPSVSEYEPPLVDGTALLDEEDSELDKLRRVADEPTDTDDWDAYSATEARPSPSPASPMPMELTSSGSFGSPLQPQRTEATIAHVPRRRLGEQSARDARLPAAPDDDWSEAGIDDVWDEPPSESTWREPSGPALHPVSTDAKTMARPNPLAQPPAGGPGDSGRRTVAIDPPRRDPALDDQEEELFLEPPLSPPRYGSTHYHDLSELEEEVDSVVTRAVERPPPARSEGAPQRGGRGARGSAELPRQQPRRHTSGDYRAGAFTHGQVKAPRLAKQSRRAVPLAERAVASGARGETAHVQKSQPQRGRSPWLWIGVGIGLAGVGAAAFFAGRYGGYFTAEQEASPQPGQLPPTSTKAAGRDGAPAPGAQAAAAIRVESKPAGASVRLCGRRHVRATPLTLEVDPERRCWLELRKRGYAPYRYRLPASLHRGRLFRVRAVLRPVAHKRPKPARASPDEPPERDTPHQRVADSKLTVTSVQVGTVYVNGLARGRTPKLTLQLSPGVYKVHVVFPRLGTRTSDRKVTLRRGRSIKLHFDP